MIRLRGELQRVLKMLDRGSDLSIIEVGNADVVMILGGSQDRLAFVADLLFARVDKNFRAFLDLRFLGMIRYKRFETLNRLVERFRMHQFDAGFVGLNGTGKLLRSHLLRRSGMGFRLYYYGP